jgi:hypothetical protein
VRGWDLLVCNDPANAKPCCCLRDERRTKRERVAGSQPVGARTARSVEVDCMLGLCSGVTHAGYGNFRFALLVEVSFDLQVTPEFVMKCD